MQEPNEDVDRTIELSRHLLNSADLSDLSCEDRTCHTFYRKVSDRAGKIIKEAENKRRKDSIRNIPKTQNETGDAT
jgi:hypothetical protein